MAVHLIWDLRLNTKMKSALRSEREFLLPNRCLFGLRNQLKSHLIKRRTKILLYKTLIRPVLTYASETWSLTAREEKMLLIFERKVLRIIFGGINDNGQFLHYIIQSFLIV